jgi:hypothetical protein
MNPSEIVSMFGMSPVERIEMGKTSIDRETFHEFLQGVSSQFTQATYSFLENNCNNFTNACCNFLLSKDIPSKILHLPSEFASTPLGQMVAPMISGMQNQFQTSYASHAIGPRLNLPTSPISEKKGLSATIPYEVL